MSETTENGTQAEDAAPLPANLDTVPASGTEQTADPAPQPDAPEEPKRTPWFQRRIDELTREKHEARRQADAYAMTLREIQQRQAGQTQQDAPPAGYVPASEVQRIAAEQVAVSRLNADCDAVADYGVEKFPDFGEAQRNLQMLGGMTPEFLEVVTGLGKEDGARVFRDLGLDPDRAERILKLPPAKMGVELARMAAQPAKPAPVSKAPAPVNPIGGARQAADILSTAPTQSNLDAWMAARNKQVKG